MMAAEQLQNGPVLSDLLANLCDIRDEFDISIAAVASDSRLVRANTLFLACSGLSSHGLDYIDAVVKAGATTILWEPDDRWDMERVEGLESRYSIPFLRIKRLTTVAGKIAARFYANPSKSLHVIAVTGTNGKTSCCHYLAQALSMDSKPIGESTPCGVIGTLGYGLFGAQSSAGRTTPDAVHLQSIIAQLRDQGSTDLVMEASSHGLQQHRLDGVSVDVAVFTNLTRDHLDYHGDMESYFKAKQRLFSFPGLKTAVINLDDPVGEQLLSALPETVASIVYGFSDAVGSPGHQFVAGSNLSLSGEGLSMTVDTGVESVELRSNLLGRFNASNLLATIAALLARGLALPDAVAKAQVAVNSPGRMERFGGGALPAVVVDYAHTPDALQQVLQAARAHCSGRLWCVFGCGGRRDRGKRAQMGAIAAEFADVIVLTDDNPRTEDGDAIIEEILEGITGEVELHVQRDRRLATLDTVQKAAAGDLVLVAGKGHETWQEVGDVLYPYSDQAMVQDALASRDDG